MAKDIFTQHLINYGSIQLFADTETDTAKLQLTDGGAYTLPLVAELSKEAAWVIYNNCSLNTYEEMRKQMFELRAG